MAVTLASRFPTIIAELRPRVSEAIKIGSELVAEDAKQRVPVGDPEVHLRDTIEARRVGPAQYEVIAGRRGSGEETFYASMVEFGTSHSGAQPYLIPALEGQVAVIDGLVAAALKRL